MNKRLYTKNAVDEVHGFNNSLPVNWMRSDTSWSVTDHNQSKPTIYNADSAGIDGWIDNIQKRYYTVHGYSL